MPAPGARWGWAPATPLQLPLCIPSGMWWRWRETVPLASVAWSARQSAGGWVDFAAWQSCGVALACTQAPALLPHPCAALLVCVYVCSPLLLITTCTAVLLQVQPACVHHRAQQWRHLWRRPPGAAPAGPGHSRQAAASPRCSASSTALPCFVALPGSAASAVGADCRLLMLPLPLHAFPCSQA
jgi:hypothetical protein